jgi:hypothetical protein
VYASRVEQGAAAAPAAGRSAEAALRFSLILARLAKWLTQ